MALKSLKTYRSQGIGGRDSSIISTMTLNNVEVLVTHDKNLLRLTQFSRIDPVFNPPLVLEINQPLDEAEFKTLSKNQ